MHVIRSANKGQLIFTKANSDGEPLDKDHFALLFDDFENFWRLHPDNNVDLCAMAVRFSTNQISNIKIDHLSSLRIPADSLRFEYIFLYL
jgi:hypothetical protein